MCMMREIEFRGRRKDNNEWVYGYYFLTPLTDEATESKSEDGWYFLTGRERHCISRNNCVYEVDPETVGQYTNNDDWKEIKVFDGDILKDCDGELHEVVWKDDQWRVRGLNEDWDGYPLNWVLGNDMAEVIGNKYEGYEV
jgi:hypothetical protein